MASNFDFAKLLMGLRAVAKGDRPWSTDYGHWPLATDPSPAEPEPKVHNGLRRAGMLLFQGFAPNPTYCAPKIFV